MGGKIHPVVSIHWLHVSDHLRALKSLELNMGLSYDPPIPILSVYPQEGILVSTRQVLECSWSHFRNRQKLENCPDAHLESNE